MEHIENIEVPAKGMQAMLQVLATIFFSVAALSTLALMTGALIEGWTEVRQALGLNARTRPLPAPMPVRVSRAWRAERARVKVRPLRAAA